MISFVYDKFLNYYTDESGCDFFRDLSDMAKAHHEFESLITSSQLRYAKWCSNEDVFFLCMANEFERFFDALAFFTMTDSGLVSAVVVLTKNRIIGNTEFIYSVGYYVAEENRAKGLATGIIKQAVAGTKRFFCEHGPHVELGPSSDYRFMLESVVSKDNAPSNKLALRHLHGDGDVSFGSEYRTNVSSNIYRLRL